ncbi:MAG: rod shape-determining protein MreC [Proteobacteria bacterium]|nr:rod shape-determining protein MreC [Pseudomonadota bacterium]
MAKSKARFFWRIILVASLLSPFVFFSSTLRPWTTGSQLTLVAQEIVYPFEYVWDSGSNFLGKVWTHYFALTAASKENTQLHSEVAVLKTKLLDYEDKLQEITRLRKLLGFTEHFQDAHVVAEVIGARSYPNFKTLRISKGKRDSVKVGMPIVTADGVVGRVIRSGQKFADVHLLIDANFNLDVLLQRTRVRGVLKGADAHCLLKLNRRAEVRIGDTLITSGIIGGFAKGLPVGKVVRISYESDNISQTITVEPWADFDRIEEVIVLENHDQELQKIIETAGESWLDKPFDEQKGG